MSIYSGFNNLRNITRDANTDINNVSRSVNEFTSSITDTARNIKNSVGVVDNLISNGRASLDNVGSMIRMVSNAEQGVSTGAAPQSKTLSRAVISTNSSTTDDSDWRVSLTVPSMIATGNIMAPLIESGGKMIFPFNPTILLGNTANYSVVQPTHTNYAYHAYENSQVDNITMTGEFFNENESDAKYWVACLHYLRSMTKMFSGSSSGPLGNPPLIARLNGYGKHVLNNIPVVITNFTTDMPADIDYIQCEVDGQVNYVPVQSVFTVTVAPNYARRSQSRFSLQDYVNGNHTQSNEGFV